MTKPVLPAIRFLAVYVYIGTIAEAEVPMAPKYTENELNKCSKKILISLLLTMQEQMEQLNRKMEQLLTELVASTNQKRFGRSFE